MRAVQPPIANTRQPQLLAPPGACDTHLHIYGPFDRYPLVAERNYDPDPHSTLDDYLKVQRALGLERAVIVTGSGNGTNNRITLDALQRMKGSFKGLALLDPAITDTELSKLKEVDFTGFRIKANGRGGLALEDTKRMIARTAGFGWHIEFMSQSMAEVIGAVPFLNSLKVPYVFDHVAHAERIRIRMIANLANCWQFSKTKSMHGLISIASINCPTPVRRIIPTCSQLSVR
jgi:predicted TIM-barrel fold metal-dependent hydrolase